MIKTPTNIKTINYAIGIVLFIWLSGVMYRQLLAQPHLQDTLKSFYTNWTWPSMLQIVLVFGLMVLNWSMEAIKWRLLIRDVQAISFTRSLRSVFSGISISLLTPNRIGEYAGRIVYLKNINKGKGIVANIVGSFAQFIAAGFFGILGMVFYYYNFHGTYMPAKEMWYFLPIIIGSTALILLLLLAYYNLNKIAFWLESFEPLKKWVRILEVVSRYNNNALLRLVLLSALRYSIFAFQYYLLLQIFKVPIPIVAALCCIFVIFWLMAIVPSIAIAEIGIRAEISVLILGAYSLNTLGIMSTSVVLWCINLIIPALIGALLLLGAKLIGNK
jgi:uncharacterized membrane protein YbhN (UPF0104 family)